mmetsp:Transcript_18280/g.30959  ORF Transcript_18280/g.30959 Transcript_18280/m.30959 type:complete len:86 (+) Transcript_18280:87-344(+)
MDNCYIIILSHHISNILTQLFFVLVPILSLLLAHRTTSFDSINNPFDTLTFFLDLQQPHHHRHNLLRLSNPRHLTNLTSANPRGV